MPQDIEFEETSAPVVPDIEPVYVHKGKASYYADFFHGRTTASGERFSQNRLTAASRRLPLGSRVTVTNADNGRSVEVVINDRGPYVKGRVIDLSRKAATELGMIEDGVVNVRVEARPSDQPNRSLRQRLEQMVAALYPDRKPVTEPPVTVAERPESDLDNTNLGGTDLGAAD
ncbi:septal ring lytic transglycosylase RlpA family protein [Azospirillum brasilense]|uniref:septal ring lytic transglycosylase RlpA family protein n=1 Tax=Azospirillum brasilense TaxID=192 RepID=UPI000E698BBB|nr:septal ring lytic transglycosylase RlpA family protein [Azospirillum brasilense]NUB27557.1 septal ring lytic transglycosylase RlpA family protein [Azospirillum brasilense]NUB35101.1 septal ring lytic transglycosylase RlpA family protein [Azospirillum brasilense]RIW03399.1 septal ring lytic transglycosylase RlpA family protein [Azospirillum brasilense]